MRIKKIVLGIMMVAALLILAQPAAADSRFYYVDGDGDEEVSVVITNYAEYYFGIWDGMNFDSLLGQFDTDTFEYSGGDAPNYALYVADDNILTLAGDDAFVDYFGPITGTDYWQGAYIKWNGINSYLDFTSSVVISGTDTTPDGIKPVPVPASALLLGSGILGLIAIGRVRRKDS